MTGCLQQNGVLCAASGVCVRVGVIGLWLALLCMAMGNARAGSPDHQEFEAALAAPFRGETGEARELRMFFRFPDASEPSTVAWRLELLGPHGSDVLRTWLGEERLYQAPIEIAQAWDGRDGLGRALQNGFYRVRMRALSGEPLAMRAAGGTLEQRVDAALSAAEGVIEQEWEVHVGVPAVVAMPDFAALPIGVQPNRAAPIAGGLPYTVYLGNLHTQSNDSDGGGAIGSCSGSQGAQTGAFGPGAGFDYARDHGLDFSAATEHNHYFDGSSGTNSSANPQVARDRYQAGLTAALTRNAIQPGFLAVYGMEWGVISNAGHMNIFNSNELFAWEFNSSGQLIGDVFTAKSDYPGIYATMQARNLIGQFNHPDASTQFKVNGVPVGYSSDGDEVMVLSEIQNTSAFSSNTTETETSRSLYESDYKKFLEAGFHVAPATNQDNHCANWGASWTNRTAVLIEQSLPLSRDNFLDALRARRVFATSDKASQLIFTANEHLMGERFDNYGSLQLSALFANPAGRTVSQIQILEGVPGRNGTVTVLAETATHNFTPALGAHFYYVRLVQDDGKLLWSAPIWVNQLAGSDTTLPTVVASVQGGRGDIVLKANASDNAGVVNTRFLVDGIERGQDAGAPYQIDFDSTTLSDGLHSLVVEASDAALNIGISSPVEFSVDNAPLPELVFANSFE